MITVNLIIEKYINQFKSLIYFTSERDFVKMYKYHIAPH